MPNGEALKPKADDLGVLTKRKRGGGSFNTHYANSCSLESLRALNNTLCPQTTAAAREAVAPTVLLVGI